MVELAAYTTLGLGGPARYFREADSEPRVRKALQWAAERGVPAYILGGGSNVVFADEGYAGLIIRITIPDLEFRDGSEPEIHAGAGVSWDTVVRGAVERGWGGIECLSGIPGSVGGTPIQNVGAYGQEVAETLQSVTCLDRRTLERRVFESGECDFGYRTSRFKRQDRGRYVVLRVAFRLRRDAAPVVRYAELQRALGPHASLTDVREAVLRLRRGKSMVLDRNDPNTQSAGSFFLNPVLSSEAFAELAGRVAAEGGTIPTFPAEGGVKVPAAWLVERAGFPKGLRRGGVGISSTHALALVNHGGTTTELLALAHEIVAGVERRFGVRLEPEPDIVA